MMDRSLFSNAFLHRRVLVTGHTGFKGAWLCEWLLRLGAQVSGIGLDPITDPSLFKQLSLADRIKHHVEDVRNQRAIVSLVADISPDFVFHLAAQPIVRLSYQLPVETFAVNVMGTIHVLEAIRDHARDCVAVFVTTDKCYENHEWLYAYREIDALGGHDPYSSSKAAAEIAVSAYRRSFFTSQNGSAVRVATARAGNVIGGGDWAVDRIVPDAMRSLSAGEPIRIRNKDSTRPWQHVLEPLGGYLWLAASLAGLDRDKDSALCDAFNFGPG
ncbi:MAG: CDP-glucose 4,6-dehydratase, partial [Chthoniobacter sp.]|nr:CDP-glucose 4,6-dehydratase [Chthoniobacter sp.]